VQRWESFTGRKAERVSCAATGAPSPQSLVEVPG